MNLIKDKTDVKNIPDARERIIKAVLVLIGEKGDINPTVREIAQKANVNLASINYYFRSKKKLLTEVEKYFAEEINQITSVLNDENIKKMERILIWANEMMTQLAEYPGIIWMLASKVINKNSVDKSMKKFINIKNSPLKKLVIEITGNKDDKLASLKAIQIFSGMINPLIMQYGVGKGFDIDFRDKKIRKRHLDTLIKSILNGHE
jgi:TetR/AcrR family transcriptional regulator, regulator of cefoperazone and chloramphenicol sensitivity